MEEQKSLKVKYEQMGRFEFQSLMQKLASTPTSTKVACHIHQIVKRVSKAREQIKQEYIKEIQDVFAERDEKGEIVSTPEMPFTVPDDKIADYKKAYAAFGDRDALIQWSPLTSQHLSDMKVSASELDLLGELFCEDEKPELPMEGMDSAGKVHQLRK